MPACAALEAGTGTIPYLTCYKRKMKEVCMAITPVDIRNDQPTGWQHATCLVYLSEGLWWQLANWGAQVCKVPHDGIPNLRSAMLHSTRTCWL